MTAVGDVPRRPDRRGRAGSARRRRRRHPRPAASATSGEKRPGALRLGKVYP